jgi:hypothetical protein
MAQEYRPMVADVATKLRELHRVLITAARRQYEQEHGPIESQVALFRHLTQNPAFGWLGPLTSLVSDVDGLLDRPTISEVDAAAVRQETNRLLNPVEGEEATFAEQLRAARAFAPELVTLHAHVRAALGALPQPNANQREAMEAARATWGESPTLAERRAARNRNN